MITWFSAALLAVCVAWSESHTHAHARAWQDTRSPADIMVDVVNDLGLNILKIHNTNNENNIALSPYGVASILTALLEGVRGHAAAEIQKCGGFPSDRDVIRVGLRDIHRLLRSYFIPQEGFLSGLSLNSEKVTLKPEYQSILRFYGYDMTSFNTPIYPDLRTTTPINNITNIPEDETTTDAMTTMTTPTVMSTQTTEITTQTSTESTTQTTTPKEETTTTPESTLPTTTIISTTTERETTTETTTLSSTTQETTRLTTMLPETTITADNTETTTTPGITVSTTESVITTTESAGTTTESAAITIESATTTESAETTTIRRVERSLVDYLIARYHDDHTSDIYDAENHKHAFLVNGKYHETYVHFMTYDAVLPFYYVHNLNALALKFPLDSPKYYLLLVLPVDEEGIDRLICDIGNTVTLKQIISHMRPTYVRAVIPSFMLRGFVILTSSLQKIGIRQIFEPRHTDFSPMTNDKDIYVTNIEQAITVMIKNYMDPTTINKNRNLYQYGPVDFKATHPFLYFVMDSEIDVTLVAGKIVNPINSRIQ